MLEAHDTQIVEQCLKGQKEAFEMLVDKYQKTIFNLAYRMTHDIHGSEDIVQTTFVKAYEHLDTFNPKYRFFSWLYRIAMNETLNHLKRQKGEMLDSKVASESKNPEELALESERNANIQKALMEIETVYRTLIVMKHFQHFSYREMASILAISEKKIKSRLFTARQLLREHLEKRGIFEDD